MAEPLAKMKEIQDDSVARIKAYVDKEKAEVAAAVALHQRRSAARCRRMIRCHWLPCRRRILRCRPPSVSGLLRF